MKEKKLDGRRDILERNGEPTFSQLILPSIFFLLVSADEELGFFVYHPCVFGAEDVGVYTGWVGR